MARQTLVATALAALAVLTSATSVNSDISTYVGARAAKASKLAQPAGVATLVEEGAVHTWVADTQNNRIQYVDANGNVETVVGTGAFGYGGDGADAEAAQLAWPHGVAVRGSCFGSNDVTMYIADTYNHRVRRVVDGRIETVAGTGKRGFRGDGGAATAARLSHPHAVAVLPADCGNWGAASSSAPGAKAAARGYSIWVADTHNNRIRRIDADGIITTVAGTGASAFAGDNGAAIKASLAWPMGLTVVPSVRTPGGVVMVIADTYNHRVRMVNSVGVMSTLAGNGKEGFSQDGADARRETLSHPTGVTAVRAQPGRDDVTVWFTDSSSHKLREISSTRALRTLAGQTWAGYRGDGSAAKESVLNHPKGLSAAVGVEGNANHVRLVFADSFNNAVRQMDLSIAADAPKVHYVPRVLTGSIEPTATATPTSSASSSSSAAASPSASNSAAPTASTSVLPSATPTPFPSSTVAPSAPPGAIVVEAVIRMTVSTTCDVLAQDTEFINEMRRSFATALGVSFERVLVSVVVTASCSSTSTLRRLTVSQAIDLNVGVITTPVEGDNTVLNTGSISSAIENTPTEQLLSTFLTSPKATQMGVTQNDVQKVGTVTVVVASTPSSGSKISGGAIAGTLVGILVGGIIIIAAIVFIKKRRGSSAGAAQPATPAGGALQSSAVTTL